MGKVVFSQVSVCSQGSTPRPGRGTPGSGQDGVGVHRGGQGWSTLTTRDEVLPLPRDRTANGVPAMRRAVCLLTFLLNDNINAK